MNRRQLLVGSAALALAHRALASGWAVLDDYVNGNVYDLGAALQVGPVQLLNREYDCLPVRLRDRDMIEGINSQSILNFEADAPAFAPVDETHQTILCTLRDFDVLCASKGGPGQHAFWMPSCSRWRLENLAIIGFGGVGVYMYGQRTAAGAKAPSDATVNRIIDCRVNGCMHGYLMGGTRGEPRIRGGTSNMNHLSRCSAFSCAGHGFYVLQGSANHLEHCVGGTNGGDVFRIGWYGNYIEVPVFERTKGWGIYFLGNSETRGNTVIGAHNGGAVGAGTIGGKVKGQKIL